MKLKSLLLIGLLSLANSLFAANLHMHPKAEAMPRSASSENKALIPGYCQIEIINSSYDNVTVYGQFDDGLALAPFNVYSFEAPHYISLYYYSYCHRDMYLDIVTFSGAHIYSGYTNVDTSIRIVPFLTNQLKAEIRKK